MLPLRKSLWLMRLIGTLSLLFAAASQASKPQTVELSLPGGVTASAWFQPGERGPAVLLLHGFLQTGNYLTVSALRASLADMGYTVLAPTLSLGVDRRRTSLACEAVHLHTLQDDLAEVAAWIAWLEARGYADIALLGHSHGSRELLAYAADHPAGAVTRLIAIGLVGAEDRNKQAVLRAQLRRAMALGVSGAAALDSYELSYCRRYVAVPDSYVSYASWDSGRVLQGLARLRMPVRVILGDQDARMPPDWPQRLRGQGVQVAVVPGAGHFFDAQYEFDLLDEVIAALDGTHARE